MYFSTVFLNRISQFYLEEGGSGLHSASSDQEDDHWPSVARQGELIKSLQPWWWPTSSSGLKIPIKALSVLTLSNQKGMLCPMFELMDLWANIPKWSFKKDLAPMFKSKWLYGAPGFLFQNPTTSQVHQSSVGKSKHAWLNAAGLSWFIGWCFAN